MKNNISHKLKTLTIRILKHSILYSSQIDWVKNVLSTHGFEISKQYLDLDKNYTKLEISLKSLELNKINEILSQIEHFNQLVTVENSCTYLPIQVDIPDFYKRKYKTENGDILEFSAIGHNGCNRAIVIYSIKNNNISRIITVPINEFLSKLIFYFDISLTSKELLQFYTFNYDNSLIIKLQGTDFNELINLVKYYQNFNYNCNNAIR